MRVIVNKIYKKMIVLMFIVFLFGCNKQSDVNPLILDNQGDNVMNTKGINIYIFDAYSDEKDTIGSLTDIPLSKSSYTITEDLLIDYDWDQQTFSISNTWGPKSLDAPGFMWSGSGIFLVTFNDQRLFSGQIVKAFSPRRFEHPAMVLTAESILNDPQSAGKLIYSFHPTSSVMYEPQSEFLADDPAIDAQVRAHLAAIGKLK